MVDDEEDLREILKFNLESEGYLVDTAPSAEEALKMLTEEYDLILLDVMMGGMSGFKMAEKLRLQRNARIIGFDNDDGEFVCFVVKNRRFVGDTAAGNAAVFLFTVVHRHAPFFVRRLRPPILP